MYINVNQNLLQLVKKPTCLNYGEIILLSLIKGMSEDERFFMSNEAIAELMGNSIRTVKRWMQNLHRLNLITSYTEKINGRETRIIKCQI